MVFFSSLEQGKGVRFLPTGWFQLVLAEGREIQPKALALISLTIFETMLTVIQHLQSQVMLCVCMVSDAINILVIPSSIFLAEAKLWKSYPGA